MSTSSQPSSQSAAGLVTQLKGGRTFDFTRKKRWGDLVVAETVEAIAFILNPSMSVLWCGSAISEVLGWREADLLDSELTDFMSDGDHARFRHEFESSLRANTWLNTLARMKVKPSANSWTEGEHITVEFRGYPQVTQAEGEDLTVVYLYAKQYHHRTPTALQDYIDLEMDRTVLEQRLLHLQSQTTPEMMAELTSSRTASEGSSSFYSSSNLAARISEGEDIIDTVKPKYRGHSGHQDFLSDHAKKPSEGEPEEGSKKKKLKKSHPSEQHVCIMCGRTDSPEWRKGPLGPKTLCNACGLRWAKQNRKTDDPDVASGHLLDDNGNAANS